MQLAAEWSIWSIDGIRREFDDDQFKWFELEECAEFSMQFAIGQQVVGRYRP